MNAVRSFQSQKSSVYHSQITVCSRNVLHISHALCTCMGVLRESETISYIIKGSLAMSAGFQDVANRVELLYSSSDPAQVQEHQRILQDIQKSAQGYEVALYLLSQASVTCQYFGALTLTVILQSADIDLPRCQQIVADSLSYIRQFTTGPPGTNLNLLVIRKLMSNISLAHLKYHQDLTNPILSFTQIYFPDSTIESDPSSFASRIPQLSEIQLELLLIFLSILIEDISKSNDFRSPIHASVRHHSFPMLNTIHQYLTYLSVQQQLPLHLNSQALKTLSSWMSYIPNMNGDAKYDDISDLVEFLFLHFNGSASDWNASVLEMIKQALGIFNEILELNPNILSHDQKQALYAKVFGTWGTEFIDEAVTKNQDEDLEEEITAYTDLVITILQLNSIRLSKTILESSTQSILQLAVRLTSIDGIPIMDEQISERMLLFWEEFASVYEDSSDVFDTLFETQEDPQFQVIFEQEKRRIFDTVARVYWRKIRLPDKQTYEQIRPEFNSYRSSVADFFMIVYSLLKADFYQSMSTSLIETSGNLSSNPEALLDAEATMFLLFKINDGTVYFESQANSLKPFASSIFQGTFLSSFAGAISSDDSNETVLSTLTQFCSSNVFYFKTAEGSKHLQDIFNVIFPLVVGGKTPTIALLASKTVMRICEECSEYLVDFLPGLETVVVEMLANTHFDALIRSRMFSAYSVIARSIQDEERYGKILFGMVSAIANAAETTLNIRDSSQKLSSEDEEEYLSSLLSCLINIAKGSSLSDDAIDEMPAPDQEKYREVWTRDPYQIKPMVISIIKEFSLSHARFAQNPIFIEKCVLILKAGLGEKLGGGFTVGVAATLQYVMASMDTTSNPNAVPFIYGLAECLVNVEFRQISQEMMHELVHRIFTSKLSFLKTDPDMIKSSIDLFSKILECKPSLILFSDIFRSTVLGYAVEGLAANESFVIKSVSKFWTNLLSLRKGTSADHEETQRLFQDLRLVETLTSQLVFTFVKAARSNLDHYYSIFRGLLGKFPVQFKDSFSIALNSKSLVDKIGTKELGLFVHRLMVTRGRRTANDVLKSFWLAANGFVEYNSQRI